jgi:serine/threonine protein kinase
MIKYIFIYIFVKRVWKMLSELIFGLVILKEHNILHRDMKDANIFIDKNNDVKLGIHLFYNFFSDLLFLINILIKC